MLWRVACARCTARRGRDSNWPVSRPCVSVACRLAFTSTKHVHTDTHAQTDRGVTEAGSRPGASRAPPPHPPPAPDEDSTRRTTAQHGGFADTIVVSRACGANQFGLSRSAERSLAVAPHARCAPARRATATVARGPPCDSVARGLVLSHLSALAARETKTRQRSSRGHLLHHAGTAGAVAQAATRRVVARPSPLRSRLSRSAALPRHERAASSRRRESGDYTPGRRSATAPAVPW